MAHAVLFLPAELTHRQASACLRQLLTALPGEEGGAVVVDASAVTTFDSSALAVLLECRRAALRAGRALVVRAMPPGLASLAQLYRVDGLLPAG